MSFGPHFVHFVAFPSVGSRLEPKKQLVVKIKEHLLVMQKKKKQKKGYHFDRGSRRGDSGQLRPMGRSRDLLLKSRDLSLR
jgi:hypothetical protein